MPLRWQLHEAHHNGQVSLLRELGCLDSLGRMRRFNGREFWPRFQALGHDKSEFERCRCRLKEDGKLDPRTPPGRLS